MIAIKLQPGDEIRVVAPSRSQAIIWEKTHHHAMSSYALLEVELYSKVFK